MAKSTGSTHAAPLARARVTMALAAVAAIGTALLAPAGALAQPYPNKPVRLVNPFPAGGAADIVARAMAQRLQEQTGQTFVVENRTGAGGNVGTELVARTAPDGYTLVIGSDHLTISKPLYPRLGYDYTRDLTPIMLLTTGPHVLLAHPSFEANTVPELVKLAKAKPDSVSYASAGTGTAQHLAGEMLKRMTSISMVHIPYKGGAPAIQDLLGGQVKLGVIGLPPVVGHIKAGRLKALGVTSPKRSALLPDVPSISESVPGFLSVQWLGLLAPVGTPADIVARLNAESRKALEHPQMQEKLAQIGMDAVPGTPADFAKFMADDLGRWEKVIREANVKVD